MVLFSSINDNVLSLTLTSLTDRYVRQEHDFNTLKNAILNGQPEPSILHSFEQELVRWQKEYEHSCLLAYQTQAIQQQIQIDSTESAQDEQEELEDNLEKICFQLDRFKREKYEIACEMSILRADLEQKESNAVKVKIEDITRQFLLKQISQDEEEELHDIQLERTDTLENLQSALQQSQSGLSLAEQQVAARLETLNLKYAQNPKELKQKTGQSVFDSVDIMNWGHRDTLLQQARAQVEKLKTEERELLSAIKKHPQRVAERIQRKQGRENRKAERLRAQDFRSLISRPLMGEDHTLNALVFSQLSRNNRDWLEVEIENARKQITKIFEEKHQTTIQPLSTKILEMDRAIQGLGERLSGVGGRQSQRRIRAKERNDRALVHQRFSRPDANPAWENQLSLATKTQLASTIHTMQHQNVSTAKRYLERAEQLAPRILIERIKYIFVDSDIVSKALQELCKRLQQLQVYNEQIQQLKQIQSDLEIEARNIHQLLDDKELLLQKTQASVIDDRLKLEQQHSQISPLQSGINRANNFRKIDREKTLGSASISASLLILVGLSLGVWTTIPFTIVISFGLLSFIFSCLAIANGLNWRKETLKLDSLNAELGSINQALESLNRGISQKTDSIRALQSTQIPALRNELIQIELVQNDNHHALLACQESSSTYEAMLRDLTLDNFKSMTFSTVAHDGSVETPVAIATEVIRVSGLSMFEAGNIVEASFHPTARNVSIAPSAPLECSTKMNL